MYDPRMMSSNYRSIAGWIAVGLVAALSLGTLRAAAQGPPAPDALSDESQAAGVLPADPSPEQIQQMTDDIREGWNNPGLRIRSARWIGEQFARAVSYIAY